MNQKGIKYIACALTGAVIIVSSNALANATGVAAVLPVAGLALVLEEGTSVNKLKNEVESAQNAASDSGAAVSEKMVSPSNILPANTPAVSNTVSDNMLPVEDETQAPEQSTEASDGFQPNVGEGALDSPITEDEAKKAAEDAAAAAKAAEEAAAKEAQESEDKYFSTLVIARVNDYVNVRNTPSEDGEVVGKLYDKSVGEFISEQDGWYEIKSGNVTGFVKAEYVVTGDEAIALAKEVGHRMATVNGVTVYVREQATTDSSILGAVTVDDELTVLEELEGWVKVSIEEGEGYVSADYVVLTTEFVTAESKAEEEARKKKEEDERQAARAAAAGAAKKSSAGSSKSSSEQTIIPAGSSTGQSVANFATQFVGNPYVYGGTSLTNGADCSGFVMSVYQNFGVGLPHSSGAQRNRGTDVGGIQNAQPGDIVAYSGHVGIYIGGGQIVHASTAKTGIKISNATYRPILSVRRIF